MSKSSQDARRVRQRETKKYHREESIEPFNKFGKHDPTPALAVRRIVEHAKMKQAP